MSKIVTCPLIASCLYDTPTGICNKHLKFKSRTLDFPRAWSSHLPGCSSRGSKTQFFAFSLHTGSLPALPANTTSKYIPKSLGFSPSLSSPPCSDPHHLLSASIALVFKSISLLPYDLLSTKQQESSFYLLFPPFKVTHWFSLVVRTKSLSLTLIYKALWNLAPTTSETSAPTTLPHPQFFGHCAFLFFRHASPSTRGPSPYQEWVLLIFPWLASSIFRIRCSHKGYLS